MGFFENIKNTFKRVFTPKKYRIEQEELKKKTENEIVVPKKEEVIVEKPVGKEISVIPKEPSVPKVIFPEKENEEDTIEEEVIPEGFDTNDLTEYGKSKINIEGVGSISKFDAVSSARKNLDKFVKDENRAKVNERINSALTSQVGEISFSSAFDGVDYGTLMKSAILANTSLEMDDKLADVILKHKEVFQDRFTTVADIYLSGSSNPSISMTFSGALPTVICEDMKEEVPIGEIVSPSIIGEMMKKVRDSELQSGHTLGASQPVYHRTIDKTESIVKVGYRVSFR